MLLGANASASARSYTSDFIHRCRISSADHNNHFHIITEVETGKIEPITCEDILLGEVRPVFKRTRDPFFGLFSCSKTAFTLHQMY